MRRWIAMISTVSAVGLCGVASAGVYDQSYTLTVVGTATSTAAYVVRGVLEAVEVNVTPPATSRVVVTAGSVTVLDRDGVTQDVTLAPLRVMHDASGNVAGGTNAPVYGRVALAGPVQVTLIGSNAGSVTNRTRVRVIYTR